MRQHEAQIGMLARVMQPEPGLYSATMNTYVGRTLTIERFGLGPANQKIAYCKETGEVPFDIGWLAPVSTYTGRFARSEDKLPYHHFPPRNDKIRRLYFPVLQSTVKSDFSQIAFSQIEIRMAALLDEEAKHIRKKIPSLKSYVHDEMKVEMATYSIAEAAARISKSITKQYTEPGVSIGVTPTYKEMPWSAPIPGPTDQEFKIEAKKPSDDDCGCSGHQLLHFGHKCKRGKS